MPQVVRAYRVKGLCLEPDILDGDTLIVDTGRSSTNGDLVIAIIEDGVVGVWRYKEGEQGLCCLENDYRKYDCSNLNPDDVLDIHGVVGKVKGIV